MALVTEVLLVSGVALDLVGEGAAGGESDSLATHAQLLAEKRIGFLLLTIGLVLYLSGIVSKSSEELALMATIAGGVVAAAIVTSLSFVRVVGHRIHEQARQAKEQQDPDVLPEQ